MDKPRKYEAKYKQEAVKGHVKHVDFLAIDMTEELEVEIPITFIGTSAGVIKGGVLTQPNHTLKVKVNPSDIPDTIEVDVSQLAIGDTLSVGDLRSQFSNFTIVQDDDYTLATVTPPATTGEDADSDDENVEADSEAK